MTKAKNTVNDNVTVGRFDSDLFWRKFRHNQSYLHRERMYRSQITIKQMLAML